MDVQLDRAGFGRLVHGRGKFFGRPHDPVLAPARPDKPVDLDAVPILDLLRCPGVPIGQIDQVERPRQGGGSEETFRVDGYRPYLRKIPAYGATTGTAARFLVSEERLPIPGNGREAAATVSGRSPF